MNNNCSCNIQYIFNKKLHIIPISLKNIFFTKINLFHILKCLKKKKKEEKKKEKKTKKKKYKKNKSK